MEKRNFLAIGMLSLAASAFAQTEDFCGDVAHSGESATATSNQIQPIGDYHYEMWANAGTNSATYYADGSFSCEFSNVSDYLCREGLFYGQNSGKSYKDIGHLYADFKFTGFDNYQGVTYSYIGVYGWSQNPLIEWYIVDTFKPSQLRWIGESSKANGCDECGLRGTITVDGAEYDVYVDKVQRGSIEGTNTPFTQYFSLRKIKRSCGTINITAHFEEWEKLGLPLGSSMYEAKVLGEAGQYPENNDASGTIEFTYAKVYDENHKPGPITTEAIPLQNLHLYDASIPAQVFDMQGRFLGSLELKNGITVYEALRATFQSAGSYLVKQGSAAQRYVVK